MQTLRSPSRTAGRELRALWDGDPRHHARPVSHYHRRALSS